MISAVVGLPGEGKSLTTSMRIRDDLNAGRTVYTNLHLKEDRTQYNYFATKDWEIILTLQDGIIYFDEGQFILDARNWVNLPVEFRQLLQKGRHEGLDFVCLTQHIMQIDVAYRRLIYNAKKVYRVFSWKKINFGIFLVFDANLQGENEIEISGFPDIVIATKDDWDYYNSFSLRSAGVGHERVECDCGISHKIICSEAVPTTSPLPLPAKTTNITVPALPPIMEDHAGSVTVLPHWSTGPSFRKVRITVDNEDSYPQNTQNLVPA